MKNLCPVTAVFLLTAAITPACAQVADQFPPGDGHDIVVKACVQCHAADTVTNAAKPPGEWAATVNNMITMGAKVPEGDTSKIIEYLAKNFPPK